MATEWQLYLRLKAQVMKLLLALTLLALAPAVMAQSPSPSPTPVTNANTNGTDALTELIIVAGNMLPRIQEAVESPLVQGLENLALWIAVIVMLFSFARLFRENDGATKDLFWWCIRLAIIFMLFGTGRTIINTWSQIGYDIVNVTEFRKVLWDAEIEFNANYLKFTEGMFLVKATSTSEAIAALTTDDVNLRNIANAANNPSAWSLPNIFIGVTIGRTILQFSEVFLALLSALILIALRLFAPFAIALAIDRVLAQRIAYPFAWSAAVFTMVTPLLQPGERGFNFRTVRSDHNRATAKDFLGKPPVILPTQVPITFGDSRGGLAGDGMGPLFVSLDSPFVTTADGTAQIDRLGTNNVAPLVTGGQLNPALAANNVRVIKDTHGKTSHLSASDLEALILYLKSLQ